MERTLLRVAPTTPLTARAATGAWFLAVGAGVAESILALSLAIHDGAPVLGLVAQVALRTILYGALFVVIDRYFRRGVPWSRWLLTLLLGTVGMASLLTEPISWLTNHSLGDLSFTPLFGAEVLLRTIHVLAVVAACALTLHPDTTAWFRRDR
ncbi:hypothetical protein BWI15_19545 [Kribbella sp. ALI-6-A]|uniref:hypothetical protein n=1 Tax=Kribbella sp. ALI-6-A TaxID=1933817 RepID=UPI00097BF4AE|nr:hypothetical protein [Kribbella sp. ALI-6-A]ONI72251.1 hypothetical protein BWI15_19545 [Kribbella sp. ALI-6-A]